MALTAVSKTDAFQPYGSKRTASCQYAAGKLSPQPPEAVVRAIDKFISPPYNMLDCTACASRRGPSPSSANPRAPAPKQKISTPDAQTQCRPVDWFVLLFIIMYYDYEERIKNLKPHRILAINRGEKEKVLQVYINVDKNKILEFLESKVIKNQTLLVKDFIKDAILDSYKRLIYPSIVREIRNILTENGEECAISNFSLNVSKLLMTPPISNAVVLGFDPAFRTGCKLAVLDKLGNVLKIDKIYPHEPVNDYENSKKKV